MGRVKQYRLELKATATREILEKADSLLKLEKADIKSMLDSYLKLLRAPTNFSPRNHVGAVANLKDLLDSFEFVRLDVEQLAALYDCYMIDLPAAVQSSVSDFNRNIWAGEGLVKISNILERVVDLIATQALIKSTPLPLRFIGGEGKVFPILDFRNATLLKRVQQLRKIWGQASEKASTVEDRFFLDQLVDRYLPDMWDMYQPFARGDSATQRKAERLIMDQLDLLYRGTEQILMKQADISLSTLQAHKIFLENKVGAAQPRGGQLTLGAN